METYLNQNNQECVIIPNADGSIWSGLKSAYDEMIAKQGQHLTENPTEDVE